MVGGRRTRVLNSDEWEYLMPNKQLIDNNLPNNNRVWVEGRNKYASGQDVLLMKTETVSVRTLSSWLSYLP